MCHCDVFRIALRGGVGAGAAPVLAQSRTLTGSGRITGVLSDVRSHCGAGSHLGDITLASQPACTCDFDFAVAGHDRFSDLLVHAVTRVLWSSRCSFNCGCYLFGRAHNSRASTELAKARVGFEYL